MCEKKIWIFRLVLDNFFFFDCEISEKWWFFIKLIMFGFWMVCCDVIGGIKVVLYSELVRC